MLYIVEGCDCAGKTTFIKQLQKSAGIDGFVHATRDTTRDDYLKVLNSSSSDNNILDRCWIAEEVYGPIMRGKSNNTIDDLYIYADAFENFVPFILFYVTASWQTIEERYKRRGDDYVSLEQLKLVYDSYEKLYEEKEGRCTLFGMPAIKVVTG